MPVGVLLFCGRFAAGSTSVKQKRQKLPLLFILCSCLLQLAVSFDFGAAVELEKRPRRVEASDGRARPSPGTGEIAPAPGDDPLTVWPVYLLWGTGDVYTLLTSVEHIP